MTHNPVESKLRELAEPLAERTPTAVGTGSDG